jgi:hypothetical protein
MVSDGPKELSRRDEQHLATGGSGDTGGFDGGSSMESDGTVEVMKSRLRGAAEELPPPSWPSKRVMRTHKQARSNPRQQGEVDEPEDSAKRED